MKSKYFPIFVVAFMSLCSESNSIDLIKASAFIKPTKFTDLDVDCLILILNELSFCDLMNVIESKAISQNVDTNYVFGQKFKNHEIRIINDFLVPPKPLTGISLVLQNIGKGLGRLFSAKDKNTVPIEKCRDTNSIIELKDYKLIENTFEWFGNMISRLRLIQVESCETQDQIVSELISNFSSESLKEIRIDNLDEKMFDFITQPIVNVKSLTIGKHYIRPKEMRGRTLTQMIAEAYSSYHNKTLNEVFPAVERLYLDGHTDTSVHFFAIPMPHLEHIRMKIDGHNWVASLNTLEGIKHVIGNNSHIRSFELSRDPIVPTNLIDLVKETLPNLDELAIAKFQLDHAITFGNVKTFAMKSYSSLDNMYLPQLETLTIIYALDKYQGFLRRHRDITTLHVKFEESSLQYTYINVNLLDYTNELPNLTDLSLNINIYSIDTIDIVDCLNSHNKLDRFQLIADNNPELIQNVEEIRQNLITTVEFEKKWEIISFINNSTMGLLLQRKQ